MAIIASALNPAFYSQDLAVSSKSLSLGQKHFFSSSLKENPFWQVSHWSLLQFWQKSNYSEQILHFLSYSKKEALH
jgi:hypothetical protein